MSQLLKKFKKEGLILHLKTIFGKLILLICSYLSKYKKEVGFLLSVIDIFNKHAWVALLKVRKGASIANAFKVILNDSKRKPTKYGLVKAVNSITVLLKNGS